MTRYFDLVPGYESLATVYDSAIEQASEGKGRERHASEGEAYENQIICEVARRVGLGYPLGQATKKIYESLRLGGERGVAELLGALNYIAAAVIVMREGLEAAPKAEGNAKGEVRLIFKSGDPVEWFSFGRKDAVADGWHPAFYLCKAGDHDYHVVQDIDGMYHVVNNANIRSPEAMYKPGDKVEALSFDGSRWEDAVVERTEVLSGQWHCTVRLASGERHCLPVAKNIRRPSRAEGCEALVEKDAPQTPQELYQHIVDCNPATFHTPSYAEEQLEHHSRQHAHKPTGEELAEMAEEDA